MPIRRNSNVPEISEETIKLMDRRNREDIEKLQQGQEKITESLSNIHTVLARMDEKLLGQKELQEDVEKLKDKQSQIKGVGKVATIIFGSDAVIHWIITLIRR